VIADHCCEATPRGAGQESIPARAVAARRSYLGIAGWLIPSAVLALMPKCPACLAVYLAAGTGLALSASAAAYLRTTLLIVCFALLSYSGARRLTRFLAGRRGEAHRKP
jgi:hypothetical protein